MKKITLVLTIFLTTFLFFIITYNIAQAGASNFSPKDNFYVTNGEVDASVLSPDGKTLYIGGMFSYVGPYTGSGAAIDQDTGDVLANIPYVNGYIKSTAPDGSGGWYIGGAFTKIGSYVRNNIAHILSDGSVDPVWNPNADSAVYALEVSGSTVYAGGNFTSIGGQARNYLAALDAATGLATAWDSSIDTNDNYDNEVSALAISGSTIYAGGLFFTIGGQTHKYLAALDATTGLVASWDPNINGQIFDLAVSGSTVYASGNFTSIGGQARNYLAALDAATGLVTAWNSNIDSCAHCEVRALAINDSSLYIGGKFVSVGGQTRNYLAAIDTATGLVTTWSPSFDTSDVDNKIYALAISGSTIYVGGLFTSVGGQTRNGIAALDATTGLATAWNPNIGIGIFAFPFDDRYVYSLAVSGSSVYVGGKFTSIGGQTRNNIAAIDTATGQVTAWNPDAGGGSSQHANVYALAVSGSSVYVGGNFTSIGGQTRNYLAALDATTGLATAWNPNANMIVRALAISGSTVYAGGDFTTIGGQTRNYLAALDATTGLATAWNPNANSDVYVLAISGSTIYAGGILSTIGGQTRNGIAAIDTTTGLATAWNPNANMIVRALAISGSTIYAGGDFTTIGGQPRSKIAALDSTTGLATAWNPSSVSGTVYALAISGLTIYAGGDLIFIGGQTRNNIAAIDTTTGLATAWNPNVGGEPYHNPGKSVYALAVSDSTVYAGGDFTTIGGQIHPCLAVFDIIYTLTYVAGANGSLTGSSLQSVVVSFSGTSITAVPDPGYRFVNWSDASTANPRTDINVTADRSVTANFALEPNQRGGGSSGGGSSSYCTNVVYDAWQSCVNGMQSRSILSQTPSSCILTSAQQAARSMVCNMSSETPETPTATSTSPQAITSLIGTNSTVVNVVTAGEARTLISGASFVNLLAIEKETYLKIVALTTVTLSQENQYTIANFIQAGTPTTVILGSGERAGSIASFQSAFNRLPTTEADWQDVIKIANGRWPTQRNTTAEDRAKVSFKKVYLRVANMSNPNDNAAITVMAYGLRPALRNLNSEKAAIKSFLYVYKKNPVSAPDWDIVRSISYSGATR